MPSAYSIPCRALIALLTTLCLSAAAPAAASGDDAAWRAEVKVHTKDTASAATHKVRSATALLDESGFASLTPEQRVRLLVQSARERVQPGADFHLLHAHAVLLRALEIDPEHAEALYLLTLVYMDRGLQADAAATLTRLGRLYPHVIGLVDEVVLPPLVFAVDAQAPERLELMRMLFDAEWDNRQLGASAIWYELALGLLRAGEHEAARAVVARIDGPREVIMMRADRRFDGLIDATSADFDPVAVSERDMHQRRVLTVLEAQRLDLLLALGQSSLLMGEHESVLAMTAQALQIIREPEAWDSAFPDADKNLPWLLNLRADALFEAERDEEAFALMREATTLGEAGQRNTSQTINLAIALAVRGRTAEATEALALVGGMSPYGRVMHDIAALVVAVQEGDDDTAAGIAEAIWAARDASPMAATDALIMIGAGDRAAAWLIEQLDDEHGRGKALLWSQDFDLSHALPFGLERNAKRTALLAREDVAQALNRVGRREYHPLPGVGGAY